MKKDLQVLNDLYLFGFVTQAEYEDVKEELLNEKQKNSELNLPEQVEIVQDAVIVDETEDDIIVETDNEPAKATQKIPTKWLILIIAGSVLLVIGVLVKQLFFTEEEETSNSQTTSETSSQTLPTTKVIAESGAVFRAAPNTDSETLEWIPNGGTVAIMEKTDQKATIEGVTSYWYKVRFKSKEGYVFGSLLEDSDKSYEEFINANKETPTIIYAEYPVLLFSYYKCYISRNHYGDGNTEFLFLSKDNSTYYYTSTKRKGFTRMLPTNRLYNQVSKVIGKVQNQLKPYEGMQLYEFENQRGGQAPVYAFLNQPNNYLMQVVDGITGDVQNYEVYDNHFQNADLYTIADKKVYFYAQPNLASRRNDVWAIEGQQIAVFHQDGDFAYVVFLYNNVFTEGYMPFDKLQFLTKK